MKKILFLAWLGILSMYSVQGQVGDYSFSTSTSTYTSLTSGDTLSSLSGDDVISAIVPLGFNFQFDGLQFSKIKVSSNGFISFDTTITSSYATNSLSGTGKPSTVIAPLWDDLHGNSGWVIKELSGSAGSHVFSVEWKNMRWRYTGSSASVSFQLKLYEATGSIEFSYNYFGAATTPSASIGLKGLQACKRFISVHDINSGTPYISNTVENTAIDSVVTNAVYTFSPASCMMPGNVNVSNILALSADITWTGNSASYVVIYGPQGFDPATQGNDTIVTTTSVSLNNLNQNTDYDIYVVSNCGASYSDTSCLATFTTLELCPAITSMSLSDATSTSLSLNWTSAITTDFNLEWGPCGFTPGTGTTGSVTSAAIVVNGLNAGTCYDFYVVSDCQSAGNGASVAAGPFSFSTLPAYIQTFPYTETFETNNGTWVSAGTNNTWEWGSPAGTVISSAANGSKAWVTNLDGSYNNNEMSYLYTTYFDFSSFTNNVYLSFNLIYRTENNYDEGWVDYSVDSGATWVKILDNGSATNWYNDLGNQWWENSMTTWTSTSNVVAGLQGEPYVQFRFAFSSDVSSTYEGFGVDDFYVAELTCNMPSGLTVSNITQFGADFTWTSNSGYTQFEFGPSGFTQGTGMMSGWETTNYSATGLMSGTSYDVYYRDSCSNGTLSNWIGPVSFITLQPVVSTFPYVQPFDTSGAWISYGTNNNWEFGQPQGTIFNHAYTGQNAWVTNLDGNYSDYEQSYLQSVIFDASSTTNDLEYSFVMGFITENCCDEGYVEYTFDGTNWMKLMSSPANVGWYNNTSTQEWKGTDTVLSLRSAPIPGSAGQPYVQIRHVLSTDVSSVREGFLIDDVQLVEMSCNVPAAIGSYDLNYNSLNLYWTSSGDKWNVQYGPTGYMNAGGAPIQTIYSANDTLAITNLTQLTCYDFYVQDSCLNGNSIWVGPINICTPPTCPSATNLSSKNITATGARLTWDGNNVPGNYFIAYGPTGSALTSMTMLTSTADSIDLINLNPGWKYDFYVSELCSPGDTSLWSNSANFTTLCTSASLQGDSLNTAFMVMALPYQDTGSTVCYNNTIGNTAKDVYYQFTTSANALDVTVDLCGSKFDTYLRLLDASGTSLTTDDDGNGSACGSTTSLIANYPVSPNTTYIVVVEGYSSNEGNYYLSISETQSCPMPTNVVVSNIMCTTSEVQFQGSSANYLVEYGASNFVLGSGMQMTTTSTNVPLNNLTTNTSYDVYVRSICNVGDSSAWEGPVTFTSANGPLPTIVLNNVIGSATATSLNVSFDASASTSADSIYWDLGDGANASGSMVSHDYTSNNTYSVTVSAYNDCGSVDSTFTVLVEGISVEVQEFPSLSIYPNPTSGKVIIKSDLTSSDEVKIRLMDIQGRLIKTLENPGNQFNVELDLTNLAKGVYFLQVEQGSYQHVERVVLQ